MPVSSANTEITQRFVAERRPLSGSQPEIDERTVPPSILRRLRPRRLIEPCRTSPAAKTPGTVVSKRNGCLCNGQAPDSATCCPVCTNPLLSRLIRDGSHFVCGTAPMKTNTAGHESFSVRPVSRFVRKTVSSHLSPSIPVTSVRFRTSMLAVSSMRQTR